jgi:Ca2+-transporting ATPase
VLAEIINSKSIVEFAALGGLAELAHGLRTDLTAGLGLDGTWSSTDTVASASRDGPSRRQDGGDLLRARKAIYGTNRIPERKIRGILELMLVALSDKVLILLSVVAAISLMLGLYQSFGQPHGPGEPRIEWVDGVTIMTTVIIVVVAGALNDYQKERQFARLNKKVSLSAPLGKACFWASWGLF